jgi:hypothetical protein
VAPRPFGVFLPHSEDLRSDPRRPEESNFTGQRSVQDRCRQRGGVESRQSASGRLSHNLGCRVNLQPSVGLLGRERGERERAAMHYASCACGSRHDASRRGTPEPVFPSLLWSAVGGRSKASRHISTSTHSYAGERDLKAQGVLDLEGGYRARIPQCLTEAPGKHRVIPCLLWQASFPPPLVQCRSKKPWAPLDV